MSRLNEYKEKYRELIKNLRLSGINYKEKPYAVIRLVFLKYLIDNCENKDIIDNPRDFLEGLLINNSSKCQLGLIKLLGNFKNEYCLDKVNGNEGKELNFMVESLNRYNSLFESKDQTKNESLKPIIDTLMGFNLSNENILALREGSEGFADIIFDSNESNVEAVMNREAEITKNSLCELASKILNISEEDEFTDFMAGIGKSTIKILGNKKVRNIVCCDIDENKLNILTMIMFLSGHKDFQISYRDFFKSNIFTFEKMFLDIPLSRIVDIETGDKIDAPTEAVYKAVYNVDNTSKDNIAVIVVPSSFLTPTISKNVKNDRQKEINTKRRIIIENKNIKAIISLPPMYNNTRVGTGLIIIDNQKHESITFINADEGKRATRNDFSGEQALNREKINKICNALNSNEPVDLGNVRSEIKSLDDVKKNDYCIMPEYYVKPPKTNIESVSKLKSEIEGLYDDLYRLKNKTKI